MKLEPSQHTTVLWSWLWPYVPFKKRTNWAQNGERMFLTWSERTLWIYKLPWGLPKSIILLLSLKVPSPRSCWSAISEWMKWSGIGILYTIKNVNNVPTDLLSHELIFYCLGAIFSCQRCAHSGFIPYACQGKLWYFLFSFPWQGTPLFKPPFLYLYDEK